MRYFIITFLVFSLAIMSAEYIVSRHELIFEKRKNQTLDRQIASLEAQMKADSEACAEAWLNQPVSKKDLEKIHG